MSYKQFADKTAALDAATAVGIKYASSIGSPWPMPQVAHGPGKRPTPPAVFYQRYYVAALDAQVADAQLGTKDLPPRIEGVDAFCIAQDGRSVDIGFGKTVVLDFKNLTAADAQADAAAK